MFEGVAMKQIAYIEVNAMSSNRSHALLRLKHVSASMYQRCQYGLLVIVTLVIAWLVLSWVMPIQSADSAIGPQEVVSYTVAPGDTLWGYAASITPSGGNVAQTVEQLKELNQLNSYSLQTGQRILVPKQ